MEVVFFWLGGYNNIDSQGINLGSKYNYFVREVEDKLVLDREKNEKYVKDFFHKENNKSIVNVTALVGDNGSGKSSFLNALKEVLSSDNYHKRIEYILVYSNGNGKYFITEALRDKYLIARFDYKKNKVSKEVIYYAPHLDLNMYPITHNRTPWIDVSTDWLIFKAYEEDQYAKKETSQIELFKSTEIQRQISFTKKIKISSLLEENIFIPSEITINSVGVDFPYSIDLNTNIRNVPYEYRDYYNLLRNKASKTIHAYLQREGRNHHGFTKNKWTRKKCYASFLIHLLKNFFYHLEMTNHFLQEGRVNISLEKLELYPFEEAVFKFIVEGSLLSEKEKKVILDFLNQIENLIVVSEVNFDGIDSIFFNIKRRDVDKVLLLEKKYLNLIGKLTNSSSNSFLEYSWRGLSTGEKAFLNLYSRINYAKDVISEKMKGQKNFFETPSECPKIIYLIIDEGELGFHPKWKKEYINNLIDIIPEVLTFDVNGIEVKPKVQIIFSTHSPISLSDIPNSHINYIQRDEKGNALVLDYDKQPQKSFGANIHTLFTDSFFLDDGLVGKFAVFKVNELIDLLQKEELSQEEIVFCQKVIDIIDEPIVKEKLNQMLQKHNSQNTELDRLERQKTLLEAKINKLRGK